MKNFAKIAFVLLFMANVAAVAKFRDNSSEQIHPHSFCHATGCVTAGPDC